MEDAPKTMLTCMHVHPVDSPYTPDDIKKSKAIRLVSTAFAFLCLLMACVAASSGDLAFSTISDINFAEWEQSNAGVVNVTKVDKPQKVYFGLKRLAVETPGAADTYNNEIHQEIKYNDCQKPTMFADGTTKPLIADFTAEICHDCSDAVDDIEASVYFLTFFQIFAFICNIMRMSESMNSSGSKIFLCVWLIVSILLALGALYNFGESCYNNIPEVGADKSYGTAFHLIEWIIILDVFAIGFTYTAQVNPLIPAMQAVPLSPSCLTKTCTKSKSTGEQSTVV